MTAFNNTRSLFNLRFELYLDFVHTFIVTVIKVNPSIVHSAIVHSEELNFRDEFFTKTFRHPIHENVPGMNK